MDETKGETTKGKGKGLTKFDSTPALIVGVVFSFFLAAINLWALIAQWHDAIFPYQVGKSLGAAIGIVLGIHCLDMIGYYRKHGRLKQ